MQEDLILEQYICKTNIRISKYTEQILTDINGEIDNNRVIVRNFNTTHISQKRSSRQKIKQKVTLNDILDDELIDVYRAFHPHPPPPKKKKKSGVHILFKSTWIFSRIDYILGHKTNLNLENRNSPKKIQVNRNYISHFFSSCNAIKLDTDYRKNNRRNTNKERLNTVPQKKFFKCH